MASSGSIDLREGAGTKKKRPVRDPADRIVQAESLIYFSNFAFTNSGKYFTDTAPGSNTASW